MKPINSIDRSFQNQRNEVIETDVPKSGFNLSYRNHLGGLVLGRLYPQSFQHLMPNDKISGNNEASITFDQLVTPLIDDIDVCVHNFLVTYRSIDNRWEKFMTPTKLNNMNKGVRVPTFELTKIITTLVNNLHNFGHFTTIDGDAVVSIDIDNLFPSGVWDHVYHSDALQDLYDQIYHILGIQFPLTVIDLKVYDDSDWAKFANALTAYFDFFIGKRSLLDYFGYKFISRNDFINAWDVYRDNLSAYITNTSPIDDWLFNIYETDLDNNFIMRYDADGDTYVQVDYGLQNEYGLRAYYAIFFEYYRNYDLEPRSNTLPEYHDFGGTTIFDDYSFANLHYLVPRIRSWQQDAFTTAGIDDISRHVFAPIIDASQVFNLDPDSDLQPTGIIDNTLRMQNISWRNPSTGVVQTINVPVPERLVTLLQKNTAASDTTGLGVELFSLRKAQMLENYLKRIYYGGDEYRDRMLHLYGARIEDYRINRPQWLSSSIDTIDPKQEVANTGVSPTDSDPTKASIGSRYATATAVQSGNDGFTEFCPEFGIYISMLSIMPHASYDPYILQNMLLDYSDFPIPQFANQMEDVISTLEISRQSSHSAFGYAPYGHAYRYRVDEVHGDYHDDKYDYVFLRFFNQNNIPNLSWSFIHCRPKLPMFVDSILLDGQCYGTFKHNFLVERPLPSPVDTI